MCKYILKSGLYCSRKNVGLGFCNSHFPKDVSLDCCICYSALKSSNILECDHFICNACLNKLRDDRCPVCRTVLKGKNITTKVLNNINLRKNDDKETGELSLLDFLLMVQLRFYNDEYYEDYNSEDVNIQPNTIPLIVSIF